MDEARLIEKLRAIEALFAGATTTVADEWSRRLFVALLHRYGLTYRYGGGEIEAPKPLSGR